MARFWGTSYIGITDLHSWYGLPDIWTRARDAGLSVLTGIDVSDEDDPDMVFLIYARNDPGFRRINTLVSTILETESLKNNPARFCAQWLVEHASADLAVVISPNERTRALEQLGPEQLGLYAGLTWGLPYHRILSWASDLSIPVIGLNRGVWVDEEDRFQGDLRQAIRLQCRYEELPIRLKLRDWQQIVDPGEVTRYFAPVPRVAETTRAFCRDWENTMTFPRHWTFPSFQGLSEDQAHRRLVSLCRNGVKKRYGSLTQAIRQRLNRELGIIKEKNFSNYFLVVHDIVRRTPRTCGRGSAAASIVSYLLGLTHVDPLKYDLFFERFLNSGRKDPPDIDIDFPWDERAATLEYVFSRYPGHSAMVADHVTFAGKSAVREIAKALGLDGDEQSRMVALWSSGKDDMLPPVLLRHSRLLRGSPRYIGTHPGGVVITPGLISDYTHVQTSGLGWPVIAWEKDGTEDMGLVKIDLLGNRSLAVLRDCIELINPVRVQRGEAPIDWQTFQPLEDSQTRALLESGDSLGIFYVESPATRQLLRKMRTASFEHLVVASSIIRPAANRYIQLYVERLHGAPYTDVHPRVSTILKDTYGIMVYQEDVSRVAMAAAGFTSAQADGLRKTLSRKDKALRLSAYQEQFVQGAQRQGIGQNAIDELWQMIISFDGYSFCKSHSASYALVSYKLAYIRARYPQVFFTCVINNGGGFYSKQVYLNALPRLGFTILPPNINKSEWMFSLENRGVRVGLSQLRFVSSSVIDRILESRKEGGVFTSLAELLRRVPMNYTEISILIRSGCLDSISGGQTRPGLMWQAFHINRPGYRAKERRITLSPYQPLHSGDEHARGITYGGREMQHQNGHGSRRPGLNPGERERTPANSAPQPGHLRQSRAGRAAMQREGEPGGGELFPLEETASAPLPRIPLPEYSLETRVSDECRTMGLMISRHPVLIQEERRNEVFFRLGGPGEPVDSRRISECAEGTRVHFVANLVTGKQVATKNARLMIFLTFEDQFGFIETVVFPDQYDGVLREISGGSQLIVYLVQGIVRWDQGVCTVEIAEVESISGGSDTFPGESFLGY